MYQEQHAPSIISKEKSTAESNNNFDGKDMVAGADLAALVVQGVSRIQFFSRQVRHPRLVMIYYVAVHAVSSATKVVRGGRD